MNQERGYQDDRQSASRRAWNGHPRALSKAWPDLLKRWWRKTASRAARFIAETIALRIGLLALGHLILFFLSYWVAFCLRFDFLVPPTMAAVFWMSAVWVISLKLSVFYFAGHFHGWWRYVTFADLAALLRAALLSLVMIVVVDHFVFPFQIPRAVLIMDCAVTILSVGALRASWRLFREQLLPAVNPRRCRWALLVGADHNSGVLAHHLQSHPQLNYRIRGFLDIDGFQTGSRLGGIPILGRPEQVRELALRHRASDVLAVAGSLSGQRLRNLMEACSEAKLALKIVPPIENLLEGDWKQPIRDIEINDLLRRDPVQLDSQSIGNLLQGRTVMVTGAGGSIGSEICRQVLKFQPQKLILVGRGENRIFFIERELQALGAATQIHSRIADITDKDRMESLFADFRPDVVFHAAAHKHVPLMEANVGEAVKNNVLGTQCVADLANQYGVVCFVLISSDKAVRPANVMGATKHVAERYVLSLCEDSDTRFVVTRFGNVLGSAGSVVPIFQEQIRNGGPLTITDGRMTRFFMTIPEASQLVLQAAAMGKGGEIFVLDMGEPVKIVDLARDLIRLSGLAENSIDIIFTGIRRGEKLHEELYFDDEETLVTAHPKLRAAYHRPCDPAEVQLATQELKSLIHEPEETIRSKLKEIVTEYQTVNADGETSYLPDLQSEVTNRL